MQNFLFTHTVAFALGYITGKRSEKQNDRQYALMYNKAYIFKDCDNLGIF